MIDGFINCGHVDLVEEYTFAFTAKVISGVLGLAEADYEQFQRWAVGIITVYRDWDQAIQYSGELREYLSHVVEARRSDPRDDLITDLVTAELDGERLDDEEIYSFLRMLLPAGIETTYLSSGNLLFLLLTHPEQLEAVRSDRTLLPQAIEEGLRYESPVLLTPRVTTAETAIAGVAIPAGAIVTSMLGSANRDPDAYEDPESFDIFRDPKQHLSFGTGPHLCLGMHLARLETRVAVDALLDRFWAHALRSEIDDEIGLVPTDATKFVILILPVPEAKTTRNRIHLDLTTTSVADQEETVAGLVELGARHIDIGQRRHPLRSRNHRRSVADITPP